MYPVTFFSHFGATVGRATILDWNELKLRFSRPVVRRTKGGRLISPARFKSTRNNANVVDFSLLMGDLDDAHNINQIESQIRSLGLSAILHSTFSHQPDRPRRRIIIPLQTPAPPELHLPLWSILNEWCDQKLDRACKDPARMFLLPVVPSLPAYRTFESLVIEGQDWDWTTASQPVSPEPRPEPISVRSHADWSNDIDKARYLLGQLSAQRAEDYHDWVRVGLALTFLGEAGYFLWEEWSRSSKKYKQGETRKKWKSFKTSKLGLHSLIFWAKTDSGQEISFRTMAA